jgi:hypothetical protein
MAIGLIAGVLAGCGGSGDPPPAPGRTVSGDTETGMKLTVQTFFDPAKDPELKRVDEWRAAHDYPPVDFHRVTADNTDGQIADSRRPVTFAKDVTALGLGQSVEARQGCDAMDFEWVPTSQDETARWNELKRIVCAGGGEQAGAIAPGESDVYYLVTDRGFGERGLRTMKVFGPRDMELK